MTIERFTFTHNDHTDRSPYIEVVSDLFVYAGFIGLLSTICAAAGLAWGLLVQFSPKTILMLQYLFSAVI